MLQIDQSDQNLKMATLYNKFSCIFHSLLGLSQQLLLEFLVLELIFKKYQG